MHLVTFLIPLILLVALVRGNVEKVIFVASSTGQASTLESLSSPYLEHLSPEHPSLRRRLHARFASSSASTEQSDAWIHLSGLQPGSRYEVRICWSATQPTDFKLSIHDSAELAQDKSLRRSIQSYLDTRKKAKVPKQTHSPSNLGHSVNSHLLHVSAAADYFSNDHALMRDGLLVDVDIILDPFLFNIFPRSLLPTAIYLVIIAIGAWFLSGEITGFLCTAASSSSVLSPPEIPILFCCAFVVASAPYLLRRNMISGITRREVLAMQRLAFYGLPPKAGQRPSAGMSDYFQKLPPELWFMIGNRLKPEDKLNFAAATWQALVREWNTEAAANPA